MSLQNIKFRENQIFPVISAKTTFVDKLENILYHITFKLKLIVFISKL